LHAKRLPVKTVRAGQTASIALKKIERRQIRKGMVMLDGNSHPVGCREFEAEVLILYHSTTIAENYQAVVHCGVAQQSCKIVKLNKECIRTGDKATIRFRFMYRPEYIKEGSRLIFREGRTKGIGKIVKIVPPSEEVSPNDQIPKKNRKQLIMSGSTRGEIHQQQTSIPKKTKEEVKVVQQQTPVPMNSNNNNNNGVRVPRTNNNVNNHTNNHSNSTTQKTNTQPTNKTQTNQTNNSNNSNNNNANSNGKTTNEKSTRRRRPNKNKIVK